MSTNCDFCGAKATSISVIKRARGGQMICELCVEAILSIVEQAIENARSVDLPQKTVVGEDMSTFGITTMLPSPDAIEHELKCAGFEAHHERTGGLSSEIHIFLESDEERHRLLEFVRDANR